MTKTTQEQNIQKFKNSLKVVNDVLEGKQYNYRILGSTLVAAINQKPHRRIGDIDIVIEKDKYPQLKNDLNHRGFTFHKMNRIGISWEKAVRPHYLDLTFFKDAYFGSALLRYPLSKNIYLTISTSYLKPTPYNMYGIRFTGIPFSSVYEGIRVSNLNPKRQMDKIVLLQRVKNLPLQYPTINQSFKVYIYGVKIPKLYQFFSTLINLLGAFRVRLGKPYEFW